MRMKKILILRGIPGSGKSTFAAQQKGATIVSADDFFLTANGTYEYDRSRIQEAHQDCFKKFLKAVERGDELIIVDNMNAQAWEISPYYMVGTVSGYAVEILNFTTDVQTSAARNIHNVPEKDIERTARLLKTVRLPKHWKQSDFS